MNEQAVRDRLYELECMQACDPLTIKREAAGRKRAIREDAALYYDESVDAERRKAYYREALEGSPEGAVLFSRLHELLERSHRHHIPYHASKDQYLYPWVDLHPDGRLCCLYSGKRKDPERAIEEDFDTILMRYARFRQLVVNDRLGKSDLLSRITEIAREHKFNTEHVVPQSWFEEREPMKGDLHHLFVCEPRCNTARANYHYAEFAGGAEDSKEGRDDAGRSDAGSESIYAEGSGSAANAERGGPCGAEADGRFEPNRGKGPAARAMLYFLLRYPRGIKRSFRANLDVELLLRWHWREPVSLYEKHRNAAIGEIQGNRNPFIDLPELAGRIDFAEAL